MSVAKVIEIVSSSEKSFDDAIQQGVSKAAETLHGISGFDVVNWTADVENNWIVRYKVTLHVVFNIEKAQAPVT